MSKKGRQVFQEKNRGVTPSVAARVSPTLRHWWDGEGLLYVTATMLAQIIFTPCK